MHMSPKYKKAMLALTVDRSHGRFAKCSYFVMGVALISYAVVANGDDRDAKARDVTLGSTAAQLREALSLCSQYSEDCDVSWYEDEVLRTETLRPYRLDVREVTVGEFAQYIKTTDVRTQAEISGESTVTDINDPLAGYYSEGTFWQNAYAQGNPDFPVVHVSQLDASRYCAFAGKRLPTEAEWEYAARGEANHSFPWGDQWSDSVAYRGDELPQGEVVATASYRPNDAGYFDLSGSVAEWTTTIDSVHGVVVVKGGSRFSRNVANLRAAVRRLTEKEYTGDDVGFRCAESLTYWPAAIATQSIQLAGNAPIEVDSNNDKIRKDSPEELQSATERNKKLKINSLLSSADLLFKSGKLDVALAELDRADAIDRTLADTALLRRKIEQAQSIAESMSGNSTSESQVAEVTSVRQSNSVEMDEMLQRVKVMRKVREKQQAEFSAYFTYQLPEAIAYLFNAKDSL